jgi:hypothetical protein
MATNNASSNITINMSQTHAHVSTDSTQTQTSSSASGPSQTDFKSVYSDEELDACERMLKNYSNVSYVNSGSSMSASAGYIPWGY